MKFGYARVSTSDQNLDLQRDALNAHGCERLFEEKISSRVADRPELRKLRDLLRPGDEIVVYKLDRIARSTRELLEILDELLEQGVALTSVREPWLGSSGSAMDKLMRTLIAGFADFERDLIRARAADGRAAAQARGVRFGRKPSVSEERKAAILAMRLRAISSGVETRRDSEIATANLMTGKPPPSWSRRSASVGQPFTACWRDKRLERRLSNCGRYDSGSRTGRGPDDAGGLSGSE